MAWVSVHEKITGRKLRSLAKEIGCSQNECIGLLIRLWLWGLNNADKTGRIIDADREDVADVLAVGLEKNIDTLDVVKAMINVGWIDDEDGILYLHDWAEWQRQWYKYSETHEKDRVRKRVPKKDEEAGTEEYQESVTGREPTQDTTKYGFGFLDFWEAYPRKTGKAEAYAKYKARLNDGWSEKQLLSAAHRYADECKAEHTEMKYIKHAKTFLSDKMPFTDYLSGGLNWRCDEMDPAVSSDVSANDDDPYKEWR